MPEDFNDLREAWVISFLVKAVIGNDSGFVEYAKKNYSDRITTSQNRQMFELLTKQKTPEQVDEATRIRYELLVSRRRPKVDAIRRTTRVLRAGRSARSK